MKYQKITIKNILFINILIVSALVLSACNSNSVNESDEFILDKNYSKGVLDNGLTYYLYPTDVEEDTMTLQITVKTGSLYERDAERGYAHFIEHMAFNSTEKYTRKDFQNIERTLGIAFGAHSNAYTAYRTVNYFISLRDLTEERLDLLFDVMSQRTLHVVFNEEEVEAERGIIFSEKAIKEGNLGWDRFIFYRDTLLEETSYPSRLPIGIDSTLHAADKESLRNLYNRYYIPSRMAVSVIGDIDEEQSLELIKKYFSVDKTSDYANETLPKEMPNAEEIQIHGFYDSSIKSPYINLVYLTEVPHENDSAILRGQLVDYAVSTYFDTRITEYLLNHPDTFLTGISLGVSSIDNIYRTSSIQIEFQEEHAEEAVIEAQNILSVFSNHLNTEQGLQGVKDALELIIEEYSTLKEYTLGTVANSIVDNFIYGDQLIDMEKNIQIIGARVFDELSSQEISESFNIMYGKRKNTEALLFVGDHNKDLVSENNGVSDNIPLNILFEKNITNQDIGFDIVSDYNILDDIAGNPKAGKIVEESKDKQNDIYTWEFDNGYKVHYRKLIQDDKDDVKMVIHSYNESVNFNFIGKGLTHKVASQLADFATIDGISFFSIVGYYNPSVDLLENGVYLETNKKSDFKRMFQLLHLLYNNLEYPEEFLPKAKQLERDVFESILEDPQRYTFQAVTNYLYKNYKHRFDQLDPSVIDDVTYEDIQAYQQELLKSDSTEFVLVGDISRMRAKLLAKKWIGSLSTVDTMPIAWEDEVYDIDSTHFEETNRIDDKDVSYIVYGTRKKEAINTKVDTRNKVIARIASEYISYRLSNALREDLGESYFVYANIVNTFDENPVTIFNVFFPTDVNAVDKSLEAMHNTLDNMLPLDKSIIESSREIISKQIDQRYSNNTFNSVSGSIMRHITTGDNIYLRKGEYLQVFESITDEDISAMIEFVLAQDNFTVVSYPSSYIIEE